MRYDFFSKAGPGFVPGGFGKQGMVTVPLPGIIQWLEEKTGAFQPLEQPTAVIPPGDGIAQGPRQARQQAGAQEEILDGLGLDL